jgi:adenosylcobinamide-GDP ribazoletransferase
MDNLPQTKAGWLAERDIFLVAIQFFTRIPVGHIAHYKNSYLAKSRAYFPLMGWLVAAIASLVLLLTSAVLPTELAVWLTIAATVLVTGAFHEDGFADSCDGFGGGWQAEQVLTIMKDSRVGSYALVGVILLFAIKATAMTMLAEYSVLFCCWLLWVAHTSSRLLASLLVDWLPYVQDIDLSKAKPIATEPLSKARQILMWTIGILPLLLTGYWQAWIAMLISALLIWQFGRYSQRRIGGYTGDVLGAAQQIAEVSILVCFLALI